MLVRRDAAMSDVEGRNPAAAAQGAQHVPGKIEQPQARCVRKAEIARPLLVEPVAVLKKSSTLMTSVVVILTVC